MIRAVLQWRKHFEMSKPETMTLLRRLLTPEEYKMLVNIEASGWRRGVLVVERAGFRTTLYPYRINPNFQAGYGWRTANGLLHFEEDSHAKAEDVLLLILSDLERYSKLKGCWTIRRSSAPVA